MKITQRAFSGTTDLQQMAALASAFPADNLHVVDQPYRFSSWALDDPQNAQLWVDETGNVVAWVVMQTPFWSIDYACHPAVSEELHPQILAWADQRAQQLVGDDFGRPMWFINVFVEQERRIRDLETAGFYSVAEIGENAWTKVLLQQSALTVEPNSLLPEGFLIRPLAGMREVAAYVDLHQTVFESKSMTVKWRTHTLQQPGLSPRFGFGGGDAGWSAGSLLYLLAARRRKRQARSDRADGCSSRFSPFGTGTGDFKRGTAPPLRPRGQRDLFRKKNSITSHLPKGVDAHCRHKRPISPRNTRN
ncbi:MAG: hypothetical protein R2867_15070 [Caldilineaceae bacterium]